jgi:spore germination protein
MIYVVESGDSLYSIAKRFNVDASTLARLNELDDPDVLVVGQTIVIPGAPDPTRPTIETNAYVEWYTERPAQSLLDEVKKRGPLLTYMMPFSYDVKRDGTLVPLNWNGLEQIAADEKGATAIVI